MYVGMLVMGESDSAGAMDGVSCSMWYTLFVLLYRVYYRGI